MWRYITYLMYPHHHTEKQPIHTNTKKSITRERQNVAGEHVHCTHWWRLEKRDRQERRKCGQHKHTQREEERGKRCQ